MKNSYFLLKALLVLSGFLVMQKNIFIRKLWLISKFMTSEAGQQIISIHLLPNVSRSKGKQTTIFCQLIEYNMGNNVLEKSYTKLFKKIQRSLELLSLSHLLHDFWRKYFLCCILLSDQILLLDCLYFMRYWVICVL